MRSTRAYFRVEMMRFAMRVGVCVALGLLPAEALNSQILPSALSGRVQAAGGPQPDGVVRAQLQRFGHVVHERYSSNGMFQFWDVAPGRYTLMVQAPDYETATMTVSIPEDFEVVIELRRRKSARPQGSPTISVREYQAPKSARQQFDKGRRKAQENDCASALDHLNEAIEIFSQYANAHNELGNCYVRLNNPDLAEAAFKRALEFTASVYPALNLADLYVRQRRFDLADEVLTNAIRRNPSEGDGYYGLALVRLEEDRLEEAAQLGREAHGHPRHIADVHLLLARIYLQSEREMPAVDELKLYVKEAKPGPVRDRIQKALKARE